MKTLLVFCALALGLSVGFAALQLNQLTGFGAARVVAGGSSFDPETVTWISRVDAAGGTYESNSKDIADALIVALKAKTYESKIKYLLPLLGSNLAAARVPLRDSLGVGIATNNNFVNGDFSQATGLQGNGSTKYLDSLIKPSQLGTSSNGGLGYWENNFNATGATTELMGCYNTAGSARYVIDVRAASLRFFSWGDPNNRPQDTASGTNGHYYGQRVSSSDRRFYIDGTAAASSPNATTDAAAGASDKTIYIMGVNAAAVTYNKGRCAVSYLTDGTLSDADVADLHTLLSTYLITPTGR